MSAHDSPNFSRGLFLIRQEGASQERLVLAEQEFRKYLVDCPQDGYGHAYLAICLTSQKRLNEAEREAIVAIELSPDLSDAHYALACVLLHLQRYQEAERVIREAIRIEPDDPYQFYLLGIIHMGSRRYRDAAEAAAQGLVHDVAHSGCTFVRAVSLLNLGNTEEAHRVVASMLEQDANDDDAHSIQGWAHHFAGMQREAEDAFRRSLRIVPGDEWAQLGLVNALRLRNPLYRLWTKVIVWEIGLSERAQWLATCALLAASIGIYLIFPGTAFGQFVAPTVLGYVGLVFMTWSTNPVFNLPLLADRAGRDALSREETVGAVGMAFCLLVATGGFVSWWTANSAVGLAVGISAGLMAIPVSAVSNIRRGRPRATMIFYASLMFVTAIGAVAAAILQPEASLTRLLLFVFLLEAVASSWIAVALAIAHPHLDRT